MRRLGGGSPLIIRENLNAYLHTFVANVEMLWTLDKLSNSALKLIAERASTRLFRGVVKSWFLSKQHLVCLTQCRSAASDESPTHFDEAESVALHQFRSFGCSGC